MVKWILHEAGTYLDDLAGRGFDRVIGTSGTVLSLGALAARDDRGVPQDLRNLRTSTKAFHRLRKEIVPLPLKARLEIEGLDPRRADLAVAGSVLFDTILRRLGARQFTLCDVALREGLVLDYIHQHGARIRQVERYPDVRRRSVIELAERCQYNADHAQQVAKLAVSLFDQTRETHGLTDHERDWLEYAALLHDIGGHISYERHHRHSYYLVKNGGLRGFEPDEVEMIALVARYHRRATPKKTHEGFGRLSPRGRRTTRLLGALLRLAEGLDRSHLQPLDAVTVHDRGDALLIQLRASGDAELEAWAAGRHVAPLEQFLGRPIRFEVTGIAGESEHHHVQQPDDSTHVSRQAVRRGRHRRLREDHPARPARQVARSGWPPGVRH
jgi:exopolyphosphatase/guanosine-5'-triphosphate,3'-diphosphate pyrophosphatase